MKISKTWKKVDKTGAKTGKLDKEIFEAYVP